MPDSTKCAVARKQNYRIGKSSLFPLLQDDPCNLIIVWMILNSAKQLLRMRGDSRSDKKEHTMRRYIGFHGWGQGQTLMSHGERSIQYMLIFCPYLDISCLPFMDWVSLSDVGHWRRAAKKHWICELVHARWQNTGDCMDVRPQLYNRYFRQVRIRK